MEMSDSKKVVTADRHLRNPRVEWWYVHDPAKPGEPPRALFRSLSDAQAWADPRGYDISTSSNTVPTGLHHSREL